MPLRCLVLAIGLGKDTDTIGTMACSLAGGYVGVPLDAVGGGTAQLAESPIPETMLRRCERIDVVKDAIQWLVGHLGSLR